MKDSQSLTQRLVSIITSSAVTVNITEALNAKYDNLLDLRNRVDTSKYNWTADVFYQGGFLGHYSCSTNTLERGGPGVKSRFASDVSQDAVAERISEECLNPLKEFLESKDIPVRSSTTGFDASVEKGDYTLIISDILGEIYADYEDGSVTIQSESDTTLAVIKELYARFEKDSNASQ